MQNPMAMAAMLIVLMPGCGDSEGQGGAGVGAAGTGGSTSGSESASTTGAASTAQTGTGGSAPSCDFSETPGTSNETLDVGGAARSYVLVIPESVNGKAPVPLVFGFHGFNGSGESASQYFGLSGAEPAYYVYPQALPLPGQGGGVGWDMTSDGVDVAFVDALVADLESKHCIDVSRIFAAGHSHGASFSNHLGCYRPEVFRAIAPVAGGGPWAGACTGSVAAMLIHGSADDQVPLSNGEASRDHWLEANDCVGAASSPAAPAPCVEYAGCGKTVQWCQHTGGHEWPDFAGSGIRSFFLSF